MQNRRNWRKQFDVNAFFDFNGEIRSNNELSEVMRQTLGKLAPEQRMLAVNTIFGRDALAAVNGMINTTEDSWNHYADALAKTDAEQQAATRMDTLRGSMEILDGIFETLKLRIGDRFLPVFKGMVDRISDFLAKHSDKIVEWAGKLATKIGELVDRYLPPFLDLVEDWLDQGPDLIAQLEGAATKLAAFIKEVVAVVGPIVRFITETGNLKIILGALAVLMGISALASIVSFVAGVWSAVAAVGAFMLALSPVILIVAAIGAAIYLLYLAWQNNFLGIRDITAAVWEKLEEWFGNIVKWFSDFPATLNAFGQSLWEKAQWVIGRLGAGLEGAKGVARAGWDAVVNWLNQGRDERSGPWAQSLFDFGKNSLNKIKEGFENVRDGVKTGLKQAMDWIDRGRQDKLPPFQQNLFNFGRDAVNKVREGFENARDGVKTSLQQAMDWIDRGRQEKLPPFQQNLFNAGRDALGKLGEGFGNIKETVKSNLSSTLDSVKEHGWGYTTGAMAGRFVQGAADAMGRFGRGFTDNTHGVQTSLSTALGGLSTIFNGIMGDTPGGFARHAWGVARDAAQRIGDGLRDIDVGGFDRGLGAVIDIFNDVMDGFQNHVWDKMSNIGKDLINGLRDGIMGRMRDLRDALNSIAGMLPQWIKEKLGIHSPSEVFKAVGRWIPPGLAEGILETAGVARDAISTVMGGMTGAVTGDTSINNSRNNTFNVSLPAAPQGGMESQAMSLVNTLTAVYA